MNNDKNISKLTGKTYWQSLKELSDNPDIQDLVQSEDKDKSNGFSFSIM